MESCHELLGEIIPPKRECVVARLKRRFEGYRSRHAEAVPRHQQRSESLYSQEKEHTQQLQQRFLESKTKKSKKDKSLVTGSQTHRGATAHYVHGGTSHQAHPQQSLQYLDSSSTRVVSTASPVSHPAQAQQQQIRQGLPQDERLTSSSDDTTKCGASAAVAQRTRDEKDSFDDLLKNTTPFPHIKQEMPTRLDGGRRVDYNESSSQCLKSEVVRSGFMCGIQNSSADFLPESFANFPDGSLNPDVLRDLIADVAGNAGDLMADFNFDEVKSAPSALDVLASEEQGGKQHQHAHLPHQRHHQQPKQQPQQQQQKTIQLASCTVPLMTSNETSCQSSISPFQNSPRQPSSPQGQIRGSRNTDSPVQKTHQTQQKSSVMPPSSMTPPSSSSSSVPSVASTTAPPYPMIPRSPLDSVSNQTTFGSTIMSTSVASRASPNAGALVGSGGSGGLSMSAATTGSQQTSAISIHGVVSQPKLVMNVSGNTPAHAGGFSQTQLNGNNKNVVSTIGYAHNQARTSHQQQPAYINNNPPQTNNILSCDGRTLVLNSQFQEANSNRMQMLQQQQMIRRESTSNQQQRSAVFAHQQPGHMSVQQQQQHHELPKSQSRVAYQTHLMANENANLPPIHQQNHQQQQHIQHLRQQQQLQHHRSHHGDDARSEEAFNNEVQRNPTTVPSNISSNPSFVEALAFNASAAPTERTVANAHSIIHLQQQQQRQPQLCNQFRSMSNEQNHVTYQNASEPGARGLSASSGVLQRAQHRSVYNSQSPVVATQWQQQYSGLCPQTNGPQSMMSIQQTRNGVNSGNPIMMSRQNAEPHDHGRHNGPFHPGVEQRTIGTASSSIDFNNLEFLAGVEPANNELLNFDAASSALKMLDDVLGHQNAASTYKG